ncbi:MAG: PadR family transcriptional regulator [Anaerolineae bacterium]
MPRHARWGKGREGGACPRRIYRFVEPCLLLLLHQGPAHGYELVERLGALGGGQPEANQGPCAPVDSSVVYRALRAMEEQGLVTSVWDTTASSGPPRRVYHLTPLGDQILASWVADLRETVRLLEAFLWEYENHMQKEQEAHYR